MFQLTRVRMWYICKSACIPNICVRMSKSTLFIQPDITNLPRGSLRSARTRVEGFLFERLFGLLVLGLRPEIGLVNREVVNVQSRCWDKMLAVIPYWQKSFISCSYFIFMTWLLILGRSEKAAEQKTDVQGHVSTCVRVKPGWIYDGTSFVETETGILKANDVFRTFTWWFLVTWVKCRQSVHRVEFASKCFTNLSDFPEKNRVWMDRDTQQVELIIQSVLFIHHRRRDTTGRHHYV